MKMAYPGIGTHRTKFEDTLCLDVSLQFSPIKTEFHSPCADGTNLTTHLFCVSVLLSFW